MVKRITGMLSREEILAWLKGICETYGEGATFGEAFGNAVSRD